jgi:5-aminopentanamidase
MPDKVKIAGVQMDPILMSNRENLDKILLYAKSAAEKGAKLIVFPECALTGYVFASREEAIPYMEPIPGPSTDELARFCRGTGTYIIIGLLEIDGNKCYNAAALVGPEGLIGKYRKIHLPFLGIDRFLDRGDQPFQVYQTPVGNIGILICYDCTFPESARVMTLMGADILALPTNWPKGREKAPGLIVPTRAFENKVYIAAVDRVGSERGTDFIGLSKIIDTAGDTLAAASGDKEEVIYAEVNPASARQKRTILKAGIFEWDFISDRRPELYGEITKKNK